MQVPDPTKASYDGHLGIKKQMDEYYNSSITQMQSYWTQAHIDRRFAVGDQRYLASMDGENYQNQKFVFNILHQHRQMILGHQARTRKSGIVVPIEERDQQTADDLSGALQWTVQTDNMLHKITDAFDCALVTGLCMMHQWVDYRDEPVNGIIRQKNYAPTTLMMDPWWRSRDLSDCRFVWTRDYLSRKAIEAILPEDDMLLPHIPKIYNTSLRFNFMPESYQVMRRKKDNYAYDQFYYLDDREAILTHSYSRSETYEFKGDKEARAQWIDIEFDEDEKRQIEEIKQRVPCVRLAIAVNDKVLWDEYHSDIMPFTPMLAYFDPDSTNYNFRFTGIIRHARDAQYLFNRRMQIQLDILESLPSSGIDVVEDAFVDKNDAFKNGPGQVRVIKKGYTPDMAVRQIMPPQVDASAFKMTDDLQALSRSMLGINEELMGMADDSKAGILEVVRQGAALTTLEPLFSNLDLCQKEFFKKIVALMQDEYTPAMVNRILGHEPQKNFFNKSFRHFDCVVEEGLNTASQKQLQFAQLLQLQQMGVPVSPQMLVKSSTLQNKKDLIDDIMQQMQQKQQQEQQQAQSQQMVAEANAKLMDSQAAANEGIAIERLSRVNENQMMAKERVAKAEMDNDQAILHQVETAVKLQELDLNNLFKFIEIVKALKESQQIQTNQATPQVEAQNGQRSI